MYYLHLPFFKKHPHSLRSEWNAPICCTTGTGKIRVYLMLQSRRQPTKHASNHATKWKREKSTELIALIFPLNVVHNWCDNIDRMSLSNKYWHWCDNFVRELIRFSFMRWKVIRATCVSVSMYVCVCVPCVCACVWERERECKFVRLVVLSRGCVDGGNRVLFANVFIVCLCACNDSNTKRHIFSHCERRWKSLNLLICITIRQTNVKSWEKLF